MIRERKFQKGFTLVESLVAIGILVVAVVGTLTAVQTSISSYIHSKNQVIAFYLAQEAFEQVRNLRDENKLSGRNWLSGIAETSGDPCSLGNACTADPARESVLRRCPSVGNCAPIRQDSQNGFYGYHPSWTPTIFTREITVAPINESEIAVTVQVTWNKGIVSRSFKARENLLDWHWQ